MKVMSKHSLRERIVEILKLKGAKTIPELAQELKVSREAVRIQIQLLYNAGWVVKGEPERIRRRGRPSWVYTLTPLGDHQFPKAYSTLARIFIGTLVRQHPDSFKAILAARVEQRVEELNAQISRSLDLPEKLEYLKNIYMENDPFMEVKEEKGNLYLIEHNCPFLEVALEYPQICSLTLSILTRLLQCQVIREKRFQNGDGCCKFRIDPHSQPPREPLILETLP